MDPIQAQLVAMSMIPSSPARRGAGALSDRDADGRRFAPPLRARHRRPST